MIKMNHKIFCEKGYRILRIFDSPSKLRMVRNIYLPMSLEEQYTTIRSSSSAGPL